MMVNLAEILKGNRWATEISELPCFRNSPCQQQTTQACLQLHRFHVWWGVVCCPCDVLLLRGSMRDNLLHPKWSFVIHFLEGVDWTGA